MVDVAGLLAGVASGDRVARRGVVDAYEGLDRVARSELVEGLASAAGEGDRAALGVLIEVIDRYQLDRPAIRRILVDDDEVDEAHQDTLIAVAQSIARFRGESAFMTWLHAVARNTASAQLRRAKRMLPPTEDVDVGLTGQRLSSMISSRADLQAAVADLPDHYRDAVVLRDVEGWSYDAIAARVGVPVNTVKSRISRGRALVAAAMTEAV